MHPVDAAVLRRTARGHRLKIERLGLEVPRPDEVLVRIVASGICRTDVDLCETEDAIVLGHEGAGVVAEVGARVKAVRPGDHVVLSYQSCGRCAACRDGRPAHCERFFAANFSGARLDGSNAFRPSGVRGHFFGQSSFATFALATERNLVKVPKGLPLPLLAPLGCGLQTGAGTVMNSLDIRAGKSVAVFGAGSVGLAAIMAARLRKANPIIAVDLRRSRLRLARDLGATHVVTSAGDLEAKIRRLAPDGVDFALEITGSPDVLRIATSVLGKRGTLGLIAAPGIAPRLRHPGQKALAIIQGDAVPQRFIPKLIRLFRAGRFPFDRLVGFYPFRDVECAIRDMESGKVIKPVLVMGNA